MNEVFAKENKNNEIIMKLNVTNKKAVEQYLLVISVVLL